MQVSLSIVSLMFEDNITVVRPTDRPLRKSVRSSPGATSVRLEIQKKKREKGNKMPDERDMCVPTASDEPVAGGDGRRE